MIRIILINYKITSQYLYFESEFGCFLQFSKGIDFGKILKFCFLFSV